ncbi:dynein axonemal assembly factor 19 [Sphaeramia orbicularis]|uniref:dynein axonemal assembly factor 19 n=1 Tax=Sphaeramia orbicularis TaxID=375764 RepID=UPI00117CF74E|nr:coiled-coil domain-containing protein 103 [Sphaeramia orbicularis]XP_029997826.1 coiled-coil domain-containing protein 103 [Sphaeramia orbicularis]
MSNSQRDVINFSALQRELQTAVEAELKYKRENDAKLRAVNQKVASYQEFRDLVLASHLKPLHKTHTDASPWKQRWNPVVAPRNSHPTPPESDHHGNENPQMCSNPKVDEN